MYSWFLFETFDSGSGSTFLSFLFLCLLLTENAFSDSKFYFYVCVLVWYFVMGSTHVAIVRCFFFFYSCFKDILIEKHRERARESNDKKENYHKPASEQRLHLPALFLAKAC